MSGGSSLLSSSMAGLDSSSVSSPAVRGVSAVSGELCGSASSEIDGDLLVEEGLGGRSEVVGTSATRRMTGSAEKNDRRG